MQKTSKKKTSKLNQMTYKNIYKPGGRFITGVPHWFNIQKSVQVAQHIYWFLIAALTNYHRFCGLKQHKFTILQQASSPKSVLHWAKVKVSSSFGYSRGESFFPAFFSSLRIASFLSALPWLLFPLSHHLLISLTSLVPCFKDSYDYIVLT